jgi:hypothetical protein
VYNHTDLTRPGFAEKFARVAALADAVIIDEAHHFRNTGQQPNPDKGVEPSRYYRMFDILGHKATSKQVFLLTATPINNGLSDFRRLVELFSQRKDNYFARTIGIDSIQATFNTLERDLRKQLQLNSDQSTTDRTPELTNFISQHPIFQQLVVQRSRAYAAKVNCVKTRISGIPQTGSACGSRVFSEEIVSANCSRCLKRHLKKKHRCLSCRCMTQHHISKTRHRWMISKRIA